MITKNIKSIYKIEIDYNIKSSKVIQQSER